MQARGSLRRPKLTRHMQSSLAAMNSVDGDASGHAEAGMQEMSTTHVVASCRHRDEAQCAALALADLNPAARDCRRVSRADLRGGKEFRCREVVAARAPVHETKLVGLAVMQAHVLWREGKVRQDDVDWLSLGSVRGARRGRRTPA